MKKTGIFLLLVCLVLGSFSSAFAMIIEEESYETVPFSDIQEQLFELPFGEIHMSDIRDIEYHEEEGKDLLYVVGCEGAISSDGSSQVVFNFDGAVEANPEYPELEGLKRKFIEFDDGNAYSVERDADEDCPNRARIYNLKEESDLGSLGERFSWTGEGIRLNGNRIAYNTSTRGLGDDPNFYIGTLDPFTTSEASTKIYSDTNRTIAFDFNPSGTELIYGTYVSSEASVDYGIAIRTVDAGSGAMIDEFLIDDTGYDTGCTVRNAALSLYTTNDYIVVLTRIEPLGKGRIQRFTYDGDLVDEVETNYHVSCMTEGPDGSTIYIQRMHEEGSFCVGINEVVRVNWPETKSEPTGRPKSIVSERSFGGKTIATFGEGDFGLLKVVDPETGGFDYLAPLKTDENDVCLRIPFADLQAKLAEGADNLLIRYKGQEIKIPMSVFDCADLLAGMPCQDDATVEIQLTVGADGAVTVTVQLFVVEQVDEKTKVIHRKTIQY